MSLSEASPHLPRTGGALDQALAWAKQRGFRGHDPYDGLLCVSPRWRTGPVRRPLGILVTQLFRRSPINVRRAFRTSGVNPKAVALFLSAVCRSGHTGDVASLANLLSSIRSPGRSHACWGYNFPWQSRTFFLPPWTPTVVVTTFAGEAYLDAHAVTGNPAYLEHALGACSFILEDLHRTEDATGACLAYSPLDRSAVYNASVLGARLLVLAGQRAGLQPLIEAARPLVAYVLARQNPNGSWAYGSAKYHRWIDSFHTGFVLGALDVFRRATNDDASRDAVLRGASFYESQFFGPRGEPFYYPRRKYPFDVHSAATGVLTLLQLRDLFPHFEQRARTVGRWMVDNMQDPDGFFYYQVRRTHTVKIPYMRWSQAWGVRALAELVRCGVEL